MQQVRGWGHAYCTLYISVLLPGVGYDGPETTDVIIMTSLAETLLSPHSVPSFPGGGGGGGGV